MRTLIITLVSLVIAVAARAADYADLYILPVAGHAQGANGTSWRSDVVLHNFQTTPITVEMVLIETGRSATAAPIALATTVVAAGETKVLADVLADEDRNVTGAMIIGADAPFVASSRTYAVLSGTRTLGQTVVPIGMAGDPAGDAVVLAGLAVDASQRSNIGFFAAASHAPFVVEIELRTAAGTPAGTERIAVDAEGFIHHQSLAPIGAASALFRVVAGEGLVVPYGSVVDNRSAEAIFLPAPALTNGGSAAAALTRSLLRR
jgi:hypothetical protein